MPTLSPSIDGGLLTQNTNPFTPSMNKTTEQPPPYTLTDDDRELISELQRHQRELGMAGDEFARRHLSYSGTVWGRIVSGEYWTMVRDAERVISTLRSDLRSLEAARLLEARYGADEFIKHEDAALLLEAVKQARAKPLSDSRRLILYIAPTGGGKSFCAGRLRFEFSARIVEARESWMDRDRGYRAALRDIARAGGVNPDNFNLPQAIEDELVRRLNSRRQVIVIDEGEFFTARTLNLVKLILNKTTAVVVICCLPSAFDRWSTRNWDEAAQLRRRTHALIRTAPCDVRTAKLFLRSVGPDESALKAAAAYARDFGAFSTLAELRAELSGESGCDRAAIVKAGNRVRACQGLPPLFE